MSGSDQTGIDGLMDCWIFALLAEWRRPAKTENIDPSIHKSINP
jgi:hypothetical protein